MQFTHSWDSELSALETRCRITELIWRIKVISRNNCSRGAKYKPSKSIQFIPNHGDDIFFYDSRNLIISTWTLVINYIYRPILSKKAWFPFCYCISWRMWYPNIINQILFMFVQFVSYISSNINVTRHRNLKCYSDGMGHCHLIRLLICVRSHKYR